MCQVLVWIPLDWLGLPNIPIYGFGTMLFLAFISGVWLAGRLARRGGVPAERIERLAIWLFIFGIIGARLAYMIVTPTMSWLRFGAIWDGGLVYFGSFVGGVLGFFVAARSIVRDFNVSRWKLADFLAPSLALGLCLGRIGCLLNGCCYGNVACTHCPAVHFPLSSPPREVFVFRGLQTAAGFVVPDRETTVGPVEPKSRAFAAGLRPDDKIIRVNGNKVENYGDLVSSMGEKWERGRTDLVLTVMRGEQEIQLPPFYPETVGLHPTQVYESISMALLFLVLLAYYPLKRRDGSVLILFMLAYSLHRFLNEMLRTDTDKVAFNMTLSQNLSILMALAAGVLIVLSWRMPQPTMPTSAAPASPAPA